MAPGTTLTCIGDNIGTHFIIPNSDDNHCSPGYNHVAGVDAGNDTCSQNICICENGVAATGAQCTEDGAEICISCNDQFYIRGNTCNNNQLVTITPILGSNEN